MFSCYLSPLQFLFSEADCASFGQADTEKLYVYFLSLFSSFLFFFVVVCFLSSLSFSCSGGDVRPLELVVIGRGQITTPYILVIPSEGDYFFIDRIFCSPCSIFHHSTTMNTTQTLLSKLSLAHPSLSSLFCFLTSLCIYSLFIYVSFSSPSYCICLHVCSALSVAGCV